ncbi:MAG: Gfo/Idh/MocA family oxidoreductase [Pirellulaceae bacterium]|jgi:predicted dehydrogenase|nr:Gfo/Idh/MocA family oxidoreductase [Pirellulaceae bacterium]MDP7016380.1 Gfo/Idh/MocA family oxidoreductase [Pirellulaceae bacterium]
MPARFAFVGFRHPHVRDMFQRCQQRDDIDVVACCEQHAATRDELASEGAVAITHEDYATLLDEVECDVVAVGDVYAYRAGLIEQALRAGKHVISDKPLCISLDELDRIESAAAASGKVVGMMLDMRDLPTYLGIRQQLQEGAIGELRAMSFDGQHPLLRGKRPGWYFEDGLHGGTLNDIAIHAIDMIPWATGHEISTVVGARCWNARVAECPSFRECGQAMLTLANGAGIICDVSYLTPDSFAYAFPHYWRFCLWGDAGTLVASLNDSRLTLYRDGETDAVQIELPAGNPGGYLNAFLAETRGETDLPLTSADALKATRTTLLIQQAADQGRGNVELS